MALSVYSSLQRFCIYFSLLLASFFCEWQPLDKRIPCQHSIAKAEIYHHRSLSTSGHVASAQNNKARPKKRRSPPASPSISGIAATKVVQPSTEKREQKRDIRTDVAAVATATAGAPGISGDDDDTALVGSLSVGDDEVALVRHYKRSGQNKDTNAARSLPNIATTEMKVKGEAANVIPPLIINLGQGTTGTHGIYDLQCRMGISAMHLERYCLRNDGNSTNAKTSGSGGRHYWQRHEGVQDPRTGNKFGRFGQMTHLIDWTARSLYMRARGCVIAATVSALKSRDGHGTSRTNRRQRQPSRSACDAVRWRNEVVQRIQYSMVHRRIRAFNDVPYFGFLELLLQLNEEHFPRRPVKFIVSTRNPERWYQRRKDMDRHSIICRYDNYCRLLDFVGCIDLALRSNNISDTAPLATIQHHPEAAEATEAAAEASAVTNMDGDGDGKVLEGETPPEIGKILQLQDAFADLTSVRYEKQIAIMYDYQDTQVYRVIKEIFNKRFSREPVFGVDYLVTNFFDERVAGPSAVHRPIINKEDSNVEQKLRAFLS